MGTLKRFNILLCKIDLQHDRETDFNEISRKTFQTSGVFEIYCIAVNVIKLYGNHCHLSYIEFFSYSGGL